MVEVTAFRIGCTFAFDNNGGVYVAHGMGKRRRIAYFPEGTYAYETDDSDYGKDRVYHFQTGVLYVPA